MVIVYGTHLGIDLALMSLALPNKEEQKRDMLQVGGSGIAIIAPAIAAIFIETGVVEPSKYKS